MNSQRPQFSLERLERRLVLSNVTPITFDPEGTLVKGTGTVNGVKFIDLKRGGGEKDVFGFPAGSGDRGGKALVFATDLDGDEFIDANEVTGISLADDVKATIFGSVNGDIVTNLKGDKLSGDAEDGSTLMPHFISTLQVKGSVFGDVISGRKMQKITIEGSVENLMVGTAASGASVQFHGPDGASITLDTFTLAENVAGKGISKARIDGGAAGLFASDGGGGGEGGSIDGVEIKNDSGGLTIQAGNAGDEPTRGGARGGTLEKITVTTSEGATLIAGDGGDSDKSNADGGEGGEISGVKISALGPVSLTAGDGGSNTASNAEGGIGGSIEKSRINGSDCGFTAGDGGEGSDEGGEGGAISRLKGILSGEANFVAGNGGDSSVDAGHGGDVSSLKFIAGADIAFIRAIVAGNGGDGSVENGDGGSIKSVKFDGDIGDFTSAFGVSGMGGLFAGRAGANTFSIQADNGDVSRIDADRVAAIVAGTDSAPQLVGNIKGVKAGEIGANFDTDVDSEGANEPALDYFETIAPSDQYDLGEVPIDGLVLAFKVSSLAHEPLFLFEANTNTTKGRVDPHVS